MSNENEYKDRALRVIVSGGGTGGHIFPALSIANEIRRRYPDSRILFVGAEGRMEMERVPEAGYEIVGLPVAGFDRKNLFKNFSVLAKLAKSMGKARGIIRDFNPDIVIGVGGYASGPVLKAAQRRGIPTLLQEQNSYAGVTNKLLAKKARAVCVAYDDMDRFFESDRIIKTGNPVRAAILECPLTQAEAKKKLGFDPDKPLVFVTGGSLGARTINGATAHSLPMLVDRGVQLLWQTGKFYGPQYKPVAAKYPGVQADTFVSDMATAYRAADVVVSRAGASTISEIQLLGAVAILIPSPNVAEDHQTKNAQALASRGAAIMIPDNEARERLGEEIIRLLDHPKERRSISDAAQAMALPNAAGKIVDCIEHIILNSNIK